MNHALNGALSRARTLLLSVVAGFVLTGGLVVTGGVAPADAAVVGASNVTTTGTATSTRAERRAERRAQRRAERRAERRAARRALARRGERVVSVARNQAGDPYQYGATGPNAFDCSGLTQFVYRKATGKKLPRTSSAQAGHAKRIKRATARRGDLVFFHDGGRVYHVAIYAGRNQVWHSPNSGSRVHKAKIWTRSVSFGRIR